MFSTYCGSFSQCGFKKHIAECGVCWEDAQGRSDLDFDAAQVPDPKQSDTLKFYDAQVICNCNPPCESIATCDAWLCACGNHVMASGFYPCDEHGREVEPTPEAWKSNLIVCGGCGAAIAQATGKRYFTTEDVAAGYAEQTPDDLLTRIGQRIYDDYNAGLLPYDVAETSIETLDSLIGDNTWLGMPIIPEPIS